MSSGQEESNVIAKITSTDFFADVEQNLPEIISYLETESCSDKFGQVVQNLLREGFKHIDVESIQNLLLDHVLATTEKIFNDCLESIKFNLETSSVNSPADIEYSLNQLLKVELDVMEGYNGLLAELLSLEGCVQAASLDSVPKTLIAATSIAFYHCKQSESVYGSYFGSCSVNLTSLFRKSFEVQTCLLKVLDEKFCFDSQSEDDVLLLLFVLEKLVEVSDIVCGFELNAVVDEWKGFVKIVSKYCDCIRSRFDLTRTLTCLTSTLQTLLLTIDDQKEEWESEGWLVRQLKIGNFMLKVVIKLCQLYCGRLSRRSHYLLLQLLINLYSLEESYEGTEAGNLLRSYITVGASPLLTHLIPDASFIQEWESCCSESSLKGLKRCLKGGVFWLSVNICRKLLSANQHEVQLAWVESSFFHTIINIISVCSEVMKDGSGRPEEPDGYSVLVAGVAVLMTSLINIEAFHKTEKLLFASFCSGNFFVKIFVEDLLCLLARLSSESLVVSWLHWLDNGLSEISPGQFDPLLVHVKCLIGRLTAFLSPKLKKSRSSHSHHLSRLISDLPSNPTPQNFEIIVGCLRESKGEEEHWQKNLLILWQCVEATSPWKHSPADSANESSKSNLWWNRLLDALNSATSLSLNDLQLLDTVVNTMVGLKGSVNPCARLIFLDCLKAILLNNSSLTNEALLSTAWQLLLSFLKDPQPVVQLFTYQAVAQVIKVKVFYSQILSQMLQGDQKLFLSLSEYLNGSVVALKTSEYSQDIFSQNINPNNFLHKCSKAVILVLEEPEREPPTKKAKVSSQNFDEVMDKSRLTHEELKKCLVELRDEGLTDLQKNDLRDLIAKYQMLSSYLGPVDLKN